METNNLNETIMGMSVACAVGSIYFLGLILEFLCAILFVYHIFKRTKYFCTAFFYILTIGFGFDLASVALIILGEFTAEASHHELILNIGIFLYWYSMMLLGPWNTLMALNRFTAVWFWKKHEMIWNWKLLICGIFGMFIYPFLLSIHLLISDYYCYFHPNEEKDCEDFTNSAVILATISNGCHVITAAALGIITAFASRCKIISVTPETKKFEQFLLIQSFFSLLLYGCHLYQTLAASNNANDNSIVQKLISNLSDTYYTFFRISSALLLFFLSKTMRHSFVTFYKSFLCFWKKKANNKEGSKITVATRTTSITVLKAT